MKRFSYILTAMLAILLTAATFPGGPIELTVTQKSRMWVDGTSSVHDWTCEVGSVQGSIVLDAVAGQISEAVLSVPAGALDCDNGTMNRKAEDALKTKAHPTIKYTLTNATVTKEAENIRVRAAGMLELAGSKKEVTAELTGKPAADGGYVFTGALPLTMSDFGIDPPTAMFGALKTGDDVRVRFELLTEPVESGPMTSAK